MKARFLALAALVLGLASCQNDFEAGNTVAGGEVDFQLSVAAPELVGTRAGDAADAQQNAMDSAFGAIDYLQGAATGDYRQDWEADADLRYVLEVYDYKEDGIYDGAVPVKDRMVIIKDSYEPVAFNLRLAPNRKYHFVVFADFVAEGSAEKTPAEQLGVNGLRHEIGETLADIALFNEAINDEVADSYFATKKIEVTNVAAYDDIELKRPYGKLRVIATDLAELNLNVHPAEVVVEYNAYNPNAFNAVTGKISGKYNVKSFTTNFVEKVRDNMDSHFYTVGYDAETTQNLKGEKRRSHITLFTDYILAVDTQEPIHFTMTVNDGDGNLIKETAFNTEIPIQRNYLTTVIGNVLTTATEVEVTINDNFAGEIIVDGDIKDKLEEAAMQKNYVINLDGDFIWETGAAHGSNPLIPADAITETLTINGNGHKFIATGTGVGAIRLANGGKLILNDLTVVDQSEYHSERGETAWEFTYLEFAGETEFNNCVIDNTVALDGAKAVFNDCTFNDKVTWPSNAGQEYAAWVSNGIAKFINCSFSGARGIKVHEAYGTEVEEVVVDNCQFNNLSKKPGMAIGTVNAATKIEIKNSTFTNCQPGDQGLYMYETDTNVTTFDFSQTNNTVNATVATSEAFATILKADIHTLNIALAADVTVDVSAHVDSYYFGGNNTNVITIDGAKVATAAATGANDNAYTLTFNHKNSDWNYIRFNNDNAKWVIKNVKLTNSGYNNGPWNRHDIRFYNDVVLENVTSDKAIALLADADLTNVVISDVHPDNGEAYALWITAEGQTVNIKDCALLAHESKKTDRGIKIDNQYVNDGEAKVTLNVDGLKVKSQKKAAIMVKSKAGADITLKNVDLSEVAADTKNAVWVDSDATDYAYLVNVTGGSMYTEGAPIINGNEALKNVEIKDNSVVYLGEGEYIIPATAKGKTVKFVGTGNPEDTKVAVTKVGTGYENCDYGLDGSTVTFENITITTNSSTYIGYARCNGTYKNCIINGTYTLYGDSVFEDCTLNVSGDVYNIWTWGAKNISFERCTFNSDGKALLLYQEGTNTIKLNVATCTFNDNGALADLKAAIEIGDAPYGATPTYYVNVSDTKVNGYEINDKGIYTGTTLWANKNSMPAERLIVTVDGLTWKANGLGEDAEGNTIATNVSGLRTALTEGTDVTLKDDMEVENSESDSNGYGKTGINQNNGGTIDGGGNDFGVNAWSTWDSAINTTGGTIKNINIVKGFRGIFVNHNSENCSKVYLENVTIDGPTYTISCDQGTNNGLEATGSTFNGWTSYAATIGNVKFVNCTFGEGAGYAFCRPYAPTEFVGCEFEAGFRIDARAKVTFENCTLNGVTLTAENIATLVTSNTANATVK